MRRQGFTLAELICVIAILFCFVALLFPVFARRPEPMRNNCQSNLKQIALAIGAYAQDDDGRYPLAEGDGLLNSEAYGWAGAVEMNLKSVQVFHCARDNSRQPRKTSSNGFSSYWYNSRLNGVQGKSLRYVATIILLGDGNDGGDMANAAYSKSSLSATWLTDRTKPSFRHLDGANYAFADGHVKWLKPPAITTDPVKSGNFTFATK